VSAPLPPTQTLDKALDKSLNATSIAQMRIASIKAGLIGAAAVTAAASLGWGCATALTLTQLLPDSLIGWLVNLAVALSCGFFFGVTYRYIVRQDDNLHLGSGAVGAFAFVRSLAQIEATWSDTFSPVLWLLLTGESFLWFAGARYALDWAISQKIIEPLD